MATELEIRERQKRSLGTLLRIRKATAGINVPELDRAISDEVMVMDKEDVSWVEKIVGVQAM